jgi:hypothetical protein
LKIELAILDATPADAATLRNWATAQGEQPLLWAPISGPGSAT